MSATWEALVSCSWCHRANPVSMRWCAECHHRADVARMFCDCERCTARPRGFDPTDVADAMTRAGFEPRHDDELER